MSYRVALWLVLGLFVLIFARVFFLSEVIFPHDNAWETGTPAASERGRLSNRKFSDESSVFIPELANNLSHRHRAWLNTWNPHVELGRPALQLSGLSRAFVLTNLLAIFSHDPFVVYTALVLLTVGLTSCFALLFFRALGLHPAAGAAAALGLGFGSAVMYWLTFVMFLSTICWSICLLWLITVFIRGRSWPVALGVAFATYSLLLTGYPQMTILFADMLGLYTIVRLAQDGTSLLRKCRCALALLGCALAGLAAALPVYLDLFVIARDSARVTGVADTFFLAILPPLHSLPQLGGFITTIFDWSWLGNAIAPGFPQPFNGLSFTPVFGTLVWLSFLIKARQEIWFWRAFLLVCLGATICPPVYLYAVHHLGFSLSRIQLLCGAIVPGLVLSAYTMDAIVLQNFRLTKWSVGFLLLPLAGEILVALTVWRSLSFSPLAVVATCLLVFALLGVLVCRSAPGLVGVAAASTLLYGYPLILSRPEAAIHQSSVLTVAVQRATDGGRYAIADTGMRSELPPNQEALLGLASINSYDSLSPQRYQDLVKKWSDRGAETYGRHFRFINANLALPDPTFRFSNVNLILSRRPLTSPEATPLAVVGGIRFYRPVNPAIDLGRSAHWRFTHNGAIDVGESGEEPELTAHRVEALNDFQRIELSVVPEETLLFISQQYHRAWRATAAGRSLRSVPVNGFYQGVIVPPNTAMVELSFRPFVWWSWVPQVIFAGLGGFLLLRSISRSKLEQA